MILAMGAPVVGLQETTSFPRRSSIQPSGPKQVPGFTSLIWSFESRADDGTVVVMINPDLTA